MYYCVLAIILLLSAPLSRSSCTYEHLDRCYNLIPEKGQKSGITCPNDGDILIIDTAEEFFFLSSIVQAYNLHVWLDCTKLPDSTFSCTNGNVYSNSESFTGFWHWSSDGNTFDFDCLVLHAVPSDTDAFFLSGGMATMKTELCQGTFDVICESSLLEEQTTLPITAEVSTTTKFTTTDKETTLETTTAKTTSETAVKTSTSAPSSDMSTAQTTLPITTKVSTTTKFTTTDKETTIETTTAKTTSLETAVKTSTSAPSSDMSTEQTTVPITTEGSTTTKFQTSDKATIQETTTAKTTSETAVKTSTSSPSSDISTDNSEQEQLYVQSKEFVRHALGLCLTNHTFVTMRSVLSVSQCAFMCSRRHTECFSFNYYADESYCELNEGTTTWSSIFSSYERIESCQHFQGMHTFGGS